MEPIKKADKTFMTDEEVAMKIRDFLSQARSLRTELAMRGYNCTTMQNHFSAEKKVMI